MEIIKNLKSEIIMNIRIISNNTGITGTTECFFGEYPDYGFWNSPDEFFHTPLKIPIKVILTHFK